MSTNKIYYLYTNTIYDSLRRGIYQCTQSSLNYQVLSRAEKRKDLKILKVKRTL